jgi:hypothetical protein
MGHVRSKGLALSKIAYAALFFLTFAQRLR